jgi:hypothetical protein
MSINNMQKYLILISILTIPIFIFIIEFFILMAVCGIFGGMIDNYYGYHTFYSTFMAFFLLGLSSILLINKHLKIINEDIKGI